MQCVIWTNPVGGFCNMCAGPIRIKQKKLVSGQMFIFRANCYFQGKFFRLFR